MSSQQKSGNFFKITFFNGVSELLGTTETAIGKVQSGACERNQEC